MQEKIGLGVLPMYILPEINHLNEKGVKIHTSSSLVSINEKSVSIKDLIRDEIYEIEVDEVVLSLGVRPDEEYIKNIKENFKNVRVIGSALKTTGRIGEAVRDGFDAAYSLS